MLSSQIEEIKAEYYSVCLRYFSQDYRVWRVSQSSATRFTRSREPNSRSIAACTSLYSNVLMLCSAAAIFAPKSPFFRSFSASISMMRLRSSFTFISACENFALAVLSSSKLFYNKQVFCLALLLSSLSQFSRMSILLFASYYRLFSQELFSRIAHTPSLHSPFTFQISSSLRSALPAKIQNAHFHLVAESSIFLSNAAFLSLSAWITLCSSLILASKAASAFSLSLSSCSSALRSPSVVSSCSMILDSNSCLEQLDLPSLLCNSSQSCWLRISSSRSDSFQAVSCPICWLAFFLISWMFSRTVCSSPQETVWRWLELHFAAVREERVGWPCEGWATLVGVPLESLFLVLDFRQLIIQSYIAQPKAIFPLCHPQVGITNRKAMPTAIRFPSNFPHPSKFFTPATAYLCLSQSKSKMAVPTLHQKEYSRPASLSFALIYAVTY